jgi:hypothetical protein
MARCVWCDEEKTLLFTVEDMFLLQCPGMLEYAEGLDMCRECALEVVRDYVQEYLRVKHEIEREKGSVH